MKVRLAVPKDEPQIVAFNQAMARETESKSLEDQIIMAGVKRIFEDPNQGYYVVAEDSGKVIGTLMVTKEWSDWRNGLFWWIQSVYVTPDFRRKGVYRAMYHFVSELATTEPDICGFRLYVEKDNKVAQETYRSLGMEEISYLIYEEELKRSV